MENSIGLLKSDPSAAFAVAARSIQEKIAELNFSRLK